MSINEYLEVMHPENRSLVNDALQTMLSGERSNINFTCRMQVKYDEIWRYCNITGVPFEEEENGKISRFTGFRQNISKLHQLNEELKKRNYKMELTCRHYNIGCLMILLMISVSEKPFHRRII